MKIAILAISCLAAFAQAAESKDGSDQTVQACKCSTKGDGVCGTGKDGTQKTFTNECMTMKCAGGPGDSMQYVDGKCEAKEEPVEACMCQENFAPVCGVDADGNKKEFANECHTQVCADGPGDKMKYTDGACEEEEEACTCTKDLKPVCGTGKDGNQKVFTNKCFTQTCADGPGDKMKYTDGACEEDSSSLEEETCMCTKDLKPVCGTGKAGSQKTFTNKCFTQTCAGGPGDKMKYTEGECEEEGEACICTADFNPVCAQVDRSNQKTYSNACTAECDGAPIVHEGKCKQDCVRCLVRPQCGDDCTGGCVYTRPTCDACATATCDEGDTETPTCELGNGKEVKAGWVGPGVGADWCNKCRCYDNGELACTEMECAGEAEEKPASGCYLEDRSLVAFGWVGRGAGDNKCNKCKCAAPERDRRMPMQQSTPQPFVKGVLSCTRMECLDFVEAGFPVKDGDGLGDQAGEEGDATATTRPTRPTLVGSTTDDFWETTCRKTVCRNSKDTCADCEFTAGDRAHDRCSKTCRIAQTLTTADAAKETANDLGFGRIRPEVQDADVEDVRGVGTLAANIRSKCAAVTTDCVEDDIECNCPSQLTELVKQHAKGRSADDIAAKIKCCRDVGDKDADAIKGEIRSKLTAYVASAQREVAALAEQTDECDAGAEDSGESTEDLATASTLCDAFALISDASTEELSELVSFAASMSPAEIGEAIDDIVGGLSGASSVAGSALLAAALAAVANL